MTQVNFSITAGFLNAHISSLVSEGAHDKAFEVAMASLGNPDLDEQKRIGMASDLLDGFVILEDVEDGAMRLVETGKPRTHSIARRVTELSDKLEEKEREINELATKLCDIFDALADYPTAQGIAEDIMTGKEHLGYGHDDDLDEIELPGMGRVNLSEALDELIETASADETPQYGWLEPDGTFHDVPWGDHGKFAWDYVKEHEIATYSVDPADWLVEHEGWILVHNPVQGIGKCTMSGEHKPTSEQKKWLFDYYMKWNDETSAHAIKEGWHDEVKHRFDII